MPETDAVPSDSPKFERREGAARRRGTPLALALLVCWASASAPILAADAVRVYISADMEGIAGVVTGDQLGPTGFEYARARELMTDEVLAAIDGARAAGATEFVVSDSHGNGESLLIEKFGKDVQIVRESTPCSSAATWKPSHRVERLQHIVNWFGQYLMGERIDTYDLR